MRIEVTSTTWTGLEEDDCADYEVIKGALDLQQKIIDALRKALNKIEPEPIESTLIFGIVEQRYNNALIELGYIEEK